MSDRHPTSAPAAHAATSAAVPIVRAALMISALAALTAGLWHARSFYHDDAYIALRYAQRLLAGHGLTWTDGERVEGFTSPLWVVMSAGLGGLGLPLEPATRGLGLLALGALAWLALRVAGPLALWVVAAHPGLVAWSLGGLETTGFALWLTIGAWLTLRARDAADRMALRNAWLAGCAFAVAGLTRPEGFAAGALAVVLLRTRPASAWRAALPFAAAGIGWLVFRLAYYGDLLPNVAHAKGVGIDIGHRLASAATYLASHWLYVLPAAACAATAVAVARTLKCARVLWFALPVLGGIVFAGGDHMPYGRLLAPIAPLFALAIGCAARSAQSRTLGITVLAVVTAALPFTLQLMAPVVRDHAATVGAPVGRFLEQNLAPGSLVAVATAGSTPFHAPSLRFIDTMGLNDRVIAHGPVGPVLTRLQRHSGHLKGDGAYVLSRRPDVIVLGPADGYLGDPPTAWSLTDYQLIQSADFRRSYRPFGFRAPVTPAEAAHARVRELLDAEGRTLRFVAFLRLDSERARDLAYRGRLLAAPWD